jgi:membrane protein implicated in regulation of membrane protease activity
MQAYTLPTLGVIALVVVAYVLVRVAVARRMNNQQRALNQAGDTEGRHSGDLVEV